MSLVEAEPSQVCCALLRQHYRRERSPRLGVQERLPCLFLPPSWRVRLMHLPEENIADISHPPRRGFLAPGHLAGFRQREKGWPECSTEPKLIQGGFLCWLK